MRHALMNPGFMPVINYAPPGESGGGGDDDFDLGDENIDDEDEDEDIDESEELEFETPDDEDEELDEEGNPKKSPKKKKLSRDKGDFLSQFWGSEDEDENEEEEDAGDSEEARAALTTKVKGIIDGISLPEDFLPEDFDPSDSKQLRGVLAKALQHGARVSLQAAFVPMQAALTQQLVRIRQEMKAQVGEGINSNSVRAQLSRRVPASTNPEHKQVVKLVLNQAKQRFPGDSRKQTISAIKALAGLGITKASASKNRPSGSTREKTSTSVLDSFAPMPKRSAGTSRAESRLRRGS